MPATPRPLPPHPQRRRLLAAPLVAAALAAAFLYFRPGGGGRTPPAVSPWTGPVPVRTTVAALGDLEVVLRAIGTVTPLNTVTVRSRVDGELVEVLFQEGQYVEAGQLLARIDPRPYEAQLAQAEGQQQQNVALLRNAELDLKRYQTLYKQDSIARQQLDSQQALVRQYQGTTRIDEGRVDDARLQLSFTRIEAPLSGRIGLRAVDAGNLVSSGDAEGLATITQVKPISTIFSIPENQLPQVLEQVRAGQALQVEAWDRDESRRLAVGRLATLDNRIDTATGTLRLRAEFDNADEALFPNQFVNVRLRVNVLRNVLTIPGDAVQYGSRGNYVYVVTPDQKASVRLIRTGPSDQGRIAVLEGLAEGERVVLEGLDRLSEGRAVQVVADPPASGGPATGAPGTQAGQGQGQDARPRRRRGG